MATPEQPPNSQDSKLEDRPRPVATDSGDVQSQTPESSAGDQTSDSVPPLQDLDRKKLQDRVLETEAWVQRLKAARAEGTRLSQEASRVSDRPITTSRSQETPSDTRGPRTDVDHLVEVLNKGDDRSFVSSVLDAAERRTINRFATEENNRALAQRITQIVDEHAPDVPMDLFWSYTEDAIRIAPNDVATQIEAAIKLSRRALAQRDERMKTRRETNANNRKSADTLDGSRDRPRGADTADDKRTMVDDIKAFQASRR